MQDPHMPTQYLKVLFIQKMVVNLKGGYDEYRWTRIGRSVQVACVATTVAINDTVTLISGLLRRECRFICSTLDASSIHL